MNFILLLCLFIALYQCQGYGKKFNELYLSKASTKCINGVFVMLVFLSHFKQYIEMGPYDQIYKNILGNIGQYMVVTFLFFSGYGVMYSIKKKGLDYVKSIPKLRFSKVLLHFAIAVLIFYFVNLMYDKHYGIKKVLLSMIGWESIGNSNWYIFCVLGLYLATFIVYSLCCRVRVKYTDVIGAGMIVVWCVCFVLLLRPHRPEYYFNTAIAYPFGMLYLLYEKKICNLIQKNNVRYISTVIFTVALFKFICPYRGKFIVYEISVLLFMIMVLLFSMKIQIQNKFLLWLGDYTFEIYILQRIPMIILKNYITNTYVYFMLSLVGTLLVAVLFRKMTCKIDTMIYCRK